MGNCPNKPDGTWNGWSSWSDCERICGTETKYRRRDCRYPDPDCKGKGCPGVGHEYISCENPCCKWKLLLNSLLLH